MPRPSLKRFIYAFSFLCMTMPDFLPFPGLHFLTASNGEFTLLRDIGEFLICNRLAQDPCQNFICITKLICDATITSMVLARLQYLRSFKHCPLVYLSMEKRSDS